MFRTTPSPNSLLPKQTVDALKATFSPDELVELSRLATPVDVPVGTELTTEGTLGRQAIVMVTGTASVIRDGKTIATVGAGDIVGEIALLSGEPRIATVVTDSKATVYALSPRDFQTLLTRCPNLERRLTTAALRRLTV